MEQKLIINATLQNVRQDFQNGTDGTVKSAYNFRLCYRTISLLYPTPRNERLDDLLYVNSPVANAGIL